MILSKYNKRFLLFFREFVSSSFGMSFIANIFAISFFSHIVLFCYAVNPIAHIAVAQDNPFHHRQQRNVIEPDGLFLSNEDKIEKQLLNDLFKAEETMKADEDRTEVLSPSLSCQLTFLFFLPCTVQFIMISDDS